VFFNCKWRIEKLVFLNEGKNFHTVGTVLKSPVPEILTVIKQNIQVAIKQRSNRTRNSDSFTIVQGNSSSLSKCFLIANGELRSWFF
jgi:hypothetical protein